MTANAPPLSAAKAALLAKYLRGDMPQGAARPPGIPRRPPDERIPLSYGQQQIWLLSQIAPDRPTYNESVTIRLTGPLDVAALERSFGEVIRRHEVWRTTFATVDGQPVQVIHDPPCVSLPISDLSELPAADREAEALRLATADACLPFNLTRGPLLRPRLIRLHDTEHWLALTVHHTVFDVVSIYQVLVSELSALYVAFTAGEPSPLPEPIIQYADYAHWQRRAVGDDMLARHLPYWRGLLADAPMLQLPTDHPRPAAQTFRGAVQRFALSKTLTDALKELSHREGVTLYMTLLAALLTLLHRYAGQDDIVIGTLIGSRDQPETEHLIGFFLNTLALRADLSGDPTFRELLVRVRAATLDGQAHRAVPFELVVRDLHPRRNLTQNPLFGVMFTLEPPLPPTGGPWSVGPLAIDTGTAKFDLSVELDDRAEGIIGRFQYSTDLFEAHTIARMMGHYRTLLGAVAAEPGRRLSDLPLLTDDERQQMLVAWNATDAAYPRDRTLPELFAEQVARTPDAIAAVFGGERLTYRALDQRANQLAHHLRARGVGTEVLVGICVDRSIEMLVGLLAILKAGGAYVPLDPAYPAERLAFMLADARARVLVTEKGHIAKLPARDAAVVCLDRDQEAIAAQPTHPPCPTATPENLAYVIYTSGSTGTPKGVMIPHRALTNFLWCMRARLGITDDDVMIGSTSLSFDIAGLELSLPLLVGARVVIVPRDITTHGRRFAALIESGGATIMQATPTTWRALLDAGWRGSARLHILCGGEALPQDLARQLLRAGRRLTNLYGPTETTIWSTLHDVTDADTPIPLGRPIANTQIFILDDARRPVPVGVPGELYIGGDGLARGYLRRSDLTDQRFIPVTLDGERETRLYATGDRARYQPDGTIAFLGRTDSQVKVRGVRVELGEIEALLERYPGVRQAAAMAREDAAGNTALVAYIVPARDPAPTTGALRRALGAHLPDALIPSTFVTLDALPVTPNGKLDRRRLPAPAADVAVRDVPFVAPTSLIQLQLAQLFEEVLAVRPVGITDDFFDLGGHSLLAARLVDRITDVCGQALPLATLFAGATIEHLETALLARAAAASPSPVTRVQEGNGKRPFFFLHGDLSEGGLYCVQLARALDPDRPFFAVHPAGTNGTPVPRTLEAIAAGHLAAMRAVQPAGPYLLGGFCNGGYVAFEMARQLEGQGERVASLVMIDQGTAHAETRIARALIGRWGNLVGLDPETQLRLFLLLRRLYVERSLRVLVPDRIARIARRARSRWKRREGSETAGEVSARDRAIFALLCRYMWAIGAYAPARYRGRVAMFWACDDHSQSMGEPAKVWHDAIDDLHVSAIPGTHFSAITTHAEALAERLRAWLDAGEETMPGQNEACDV